MDKKERLPKMNKALRIALREYHSDSGQSQEDIAAQMDISTRACKGSMVLLRMRF